MPLKVVINIEVLHNSVKPNRTINRMQKKGKNTYKCTQKRNELKHHRLPVSGITMKNYENNESNKKRQIMAMDANFN